ncbi:MAG: hypothetical protein HFJ07_10070 [Lachnospiraceae bacterium]|nr:hypothetical protein [Lachnospiraceae bacterium]
MKRNHRRLLLILLTFILFIVGCAQKDTKYMERTQYSKLPENNIVLNTKETESNIVSNSEENDVIDTKYFDITANIENTEITTETRSTETETNEIITSDDIDYSYYLKKIWIVDGMEEDEGWGPISLVITQIENGKIKGYVREGGMIGDNYYFYKDHYKHKYLNEFIGSIHNSEARCQYDSKIIDGDEIIYNKHSFKLDFYGINKLKAEVNDNVEETYELRPFNVSDYEYLNQPTIKEIDLDLWGNVYLFYANMESNHTIPLIFLTDEQGNILYKFSAAYHHASEVYNILVEDMNGDGLKDVKVTTYFSYVEEKLVLYEWIFYQKEDGFFTYPNEANIIESFKQ